MKNKNSLIKIKQITKKRLAKIKIIEKEAYKDNATFLQLQNKKTLQDVANYMKCNMENIKIILKDNYYLLMAERTNVVELVDFAKSGGYIDIRGLINTLETFDKPFTCDARETTSYPILKFLDKKGFCKILRDNPYEWGGETFHDMDFVLSKTLERNPEYIDYEYKESDDNELELD